MDVNRGTVVEYLERFQVNHLIHGHTHRPGKHRVVWQRGTATRHVLPEWSETGGGYLEARDGRLTACDLSVHTPSQ
jgi:UDP-2,3-diacylglucosamine hydrolase